MGKEIVPKDIVKELNVLDIEEEKTDFEITAVVEEHQVKLPVPKELRKEIDFQKSQKVKVHYDKKKSQIIYSL